jgi:large-conductance mechanosensitive channel
LAGFVLRSGYIANNGSWAISTDGGGESSMKTGFIKEYGCFSEEVPSYGLTWWQTLLIVLFSVIILAGALFGLYKKVSKCCKKKKAKKQENGQAETRTV